MRLCLGTTAVFHIVVQNTKFSFAMEAERGNPPQSDTIADTIADVVADTIADTMADSVVPK